MLLVQIVRSLPVYHYQLCVYVLKQSTWRLFLHNVIDNIWVPFVNLSAFLIFYKNFYGHDFNTLYSAMYPRAKRNKDGATRKTKDEPSRSGLDPVRKEETLMAARGTAQWGKRFLYKLENLRLDSQASYKGWVQLCVSVIPALGGREGLISGCPGGLATVVSPSYGGDRGRTAFVDTLR